MRTAGALPVAHSLYSPSNRRRLEHWTWVPPGDGPFPLLLLLHGVYDAGGYGWWQDGRAHETVAKLVDSGDVPPVALLMPSDTGVEQGSAYCDWADGSAAAETYITRELLPWAAENLPLNGTRFVTGLSMGGYGAFLLSLRNPDLFESASSTSGFFDPGRLFDFVPDDSSRIWGSPARRAEHDVHSLVVEPDRRDSLSLALDCGLDDPLIDENRRFRHLLNGLGVSCGYAEHPGGHTWQYWADHLEDHVRFHLQAGGPLSSPPSCSPA